MTSSPSAHRTLNFKHNNNIMQVYYVNPAVKLELELGCAFDAIRFCCVNK